MPLRQIQEVVCDRCGWSHRVDQDSCYAIVTFHQVHQGVPDMSQTHYLCELCAQVVALVLSGSRPPPAREKS